MSSSPPHKAAIGVFPNQCHALNCYVGAWKKRTWTMYLPCHDLAKLDLLFKHRTCTEIIYSDISNLFSFSACPVWTTLDRNMGGKFWGIQKIIIMR